MEPGEYNECKKFELGVLTEALLLEPGELFLEPGELLLEPIEELFLEPGEVLMDDPVVGELETGESCKCLRIHWRRCSSSIRPVHTSLAIC